VRSPREAHRSAPKRANARPVRVEWITAIGKEVIVDPTDTDEGLTAEMLSETSVLEYHDPAERLDQLRAAVRVAGGKPVAPRTFSFVDSLPTGEREA
jgi:hypothetical protein